MHCSGGSLDPCFSLPLLAEALDGRFVLCRVRPARRGIRSRTWQHALALPRVRRQGLQRFTLLAPSFERSFERKGPLLTFAANRSLFV